MGCTHDWGLQLSKYVDESLPPEERTLIEEHLGSCVPCRDLLQLFRRNDSVLDNALAGEAFGSQMVESVMAEIRQRETPPVIVPEVRSTPFSRMAARLGPNALKVAAAAAVVFSVSAFAMQWNSSRRMEDLVARMAEDNRALGQTVEDLRSGAANVTAELSERVADLTGELQTTKALLQTPPDQTYGFIHPQGAEAEIEVGIKVRDGSLFKSYDLERSEHGQNQWKNIATDLPLPTYRDRKAVPGTFYDYRFTGRKKDGKLDDPMPPAVKLGVPLGDGSDPETHIDVKFIAATPARDQATFRLVRVIGGTEFQTLSIVVPGGLIGSKVRIGEREIDFSTGLKLDQMVDADQVISFTVGDRQQAFSRVNVRADLRRANSRATAVPVWRGSGTWVLAPR